MPNGITINEWAEVPYRDLVVFNDYSVHVTIEPEYLLKDMRLEDS